MNLTQKILIGGMLVIFFIIWYSFRDFGTESAPKMVAPLDDAISPSSLTGTIDLVALWTPPYAYGPYRRAFLDWTRKSEQMFNDKNYPSGEVRALLRDQVDQLFPLWLRAVSHHASTIRRIVLVVPEDVDLKEALPVLSENRRPPLHPPLVVVPHSKIVPLLYLPTFNPHMVHAYIHLIPDLSSKFILTDVASFLTADLSHLALEARVCQRIGTIDYDELHRSVLQDRLQAVNFTRTLFSNNPPASNFDIFGPVLIHRDLYASAMGDAQGHLDGHLHSHKFYRHDDLVPLEYYFRYLVDTARSVRDPLAVLRDLDQDHDGALRSEAEAKALADLTHIPVEDIPRASIQSLIAERSVVAALSGATDKSPCYSVSASREALYLDGMSSSLREAIFQSDTQPLDQQWIQVSDHDRVHYEASSRLQVMLQDNYRHIPNSPLEVAWSSGLEGFAFTTGLFMSIGLPLICYIFTQWMVRKANASRQPKI